VNPKNFFAELKRRNVYKVAIAYGVIAWLLVQIATQTFPFLEIPNWMVRAVIVLLLLGFPIALILAWAFELTPEAQEAKARYVPAYAFAVIHLALGEKDQALDWLEKAARDHAGPYIYLIKVDPYLDPLRGDPRFETLVSAILSGSVK
jgi:hypothetical protein